MTQEEKDLLLKDLWSRIPYHVKVLCPDGENAELFLKDEIVWIHYESGLICQINWYFEELKPYLRPMSSMTDEEELEFITIGDTVLRITEKKHTCILSLEQMDWLNQRCFDYRGLIPMGLALPAIEGMYNI